MLVPLSWLRDYVDLPANPAEWIERLTLAGLESSGVRVVGLPCPAGVRVKPEDAGLEWERDKVVVAKVLRIEKHPEADKLKMVTVDYGAAEPKTVITGAPNIAPGQSGMKVVLGLKGTRYFYQDKDGTKKVFTLEPKALRGIMNDAMCMSNYELGIAEDHEGIILLDESDPKPGTPVQELFGDLIVELDILPNMARCLAMVGIAREVAALTGQAIRTPEMELPASGESVHGMAEIMIADAGLCPRYTAAVIRNVKIGPSPRWMQTRLQYAGMRPINNVVDITNYVMLELGQPLHAFDYDVLLRRANGKPPRITVRPAHVGETLKTLDGQVRELGPENLVIADDAGAVALAGVMGGLETEVTPATTTLLLESASFDAVSIRKTARQFTLFSEASTRFSKGVHPEVVPLAARRAARLFRTLAGGDVLDGLVEQYPAPVRSQVVDFRRSEIARLLGFTIPDDQVERILNALEFKLVKNHDGWTVTVPPHRLDIQSGPADLIEELARVSGYDRLPQRLLAMEMPVPRGNRVLEVERRAQDILVNLGLSEVVNYALTAAEVEARLGGTGPHVTLRNPISPERSVLRTMLLPGVLEVAARNLTNSDSVALFELGFIYRPREQGLPEEPRRLAIVLAGRKSPAAWDDPPGVKPASHDFFDLKGIIESWLNDLHIADLSWEGKPDAVWLHPGRSAAVRIGEKPVGMLGELHPKTAKAFGLGDRSVLAAELDAEAILAAVPERYAYKPFNTLPVAKRDVAVIVPEDTPAQRVLDEILAAGGDMLTEASLFDVYRGDNIPSGTKSLAYALKYQPQVKTLTDKEIDKLHQKIEGRLKHVLNAQIRGKD